MAKFFGFLPGPPAFWTVSAAATQVAGAGLLGIGLFSRPTAAAMSGTMIAAVAFHLLNTGVEDFPFGVPAAHSYNFEVGVGRAAQTSVQMPRLVCVRPDPCAFAIVPVFAARGHVRWHAPVLHGGWRWAVLR